jgi:hypothetical protein
MSADLLHRVYQHYEALDHTLPLHPESGQGGKLLYAGELANADLLYAANIAGAASIAASADLPTQRQAIRDGTIDFLVTTLSEALRILKNEIRKHQPVSVGVAIAPASLTTEMRDRGVLPDLLGDSGISDQDAGAFLVQGAVKIAKQAPPDTPDSQFVTWTVDRDFARVLPQIDGLAHQAIPDAGVARHRWLRLAPRYLGRAAQRVHGISFSDEEFTQFRLLTDTWSRENVAPTGQHVELEIKISNLTGL